MWNKKAGAGQKRADYILRYRKGFAVAVVEAKSIYEHPGDGLQQAKQYAQILSLKLSPEGIGKAINFSPTLEQRQCFDGLMARTGKTLAGLGREAITTCLESQGFSKADQGIEE